MGTWLILWRYTAFILTLVSIFVGAIALSQWLSTNPNAIQFFEQIGYLGLVLVGTISGLNFIVPIPAATFSALYSAAGLDLFGVILALAGGTLIADSIGFWFGSKVRVNVEKAYPQTARLATELAKHHQWLIIPFVAIYAALVPFPNEAILIPLALTGIRFIRLLLPLLLGNIVHQAILIIGVERLTQLWF